MLSLQKVNAYREGMVRLLSKPFTSQATELLMFFIEM